MGGEGEVRPDGSLIFSTNPVYLDRLCTGVTHAIVIIDCSSRELTEFESLPRGSLPHLAGSRIWERITFSDPFLTCRIELLSGSSVDQYSVLSVPEPEVQSSSDM